LKVAFRLLLLVEKPSQTITDPDLEACTLEPCKQFFNWFFFKFNQVCYQGHSKTYNRWHSNLGFVKSTCQYLVLQREGNMLTPKVSCSPFHWKIRYLKLFHLLERLMGEDIIRKIFSCIWPTMSTILCSQIVHGYQNLSLNCETLACDTKWKSFSGINGVFLCFDGLNLENRLV